MLGNIISSSLLKTRLVCKQVISLTNFHHDADLLRFLQFRRISDEILKSTTKKCRRNVFASIHPFAKLVAVCLLFLSHFTFLTASSLKTTSYSSSFGVLRNTKEIAVALKHEVLAYDVKAKTTRPLVVGKEPMCDHLKAVNKETKETKRNETKDILFLSSLHAKVVWKDKRENSSQKFFTLLRYFPLTSDSLPFRLM